MTEQTKMKTLKVWFYVGDVRFAMEFQGRYNEVIAEANKLARIFGASEVWNAEEVK